MCLFVVVHFVVSTGIDPMLYPMRNSGCFPQGKPAATESRYPTLINHKVHAGSFLVSMHNIFDSEKLSQMCLVLMTERGFQPRAFGS